MTTAELAPDRRTSASRLKVPITKRFDIAGVVLPVVALVALFLYSGYLNPETFNYLGLNLVFSAAVPLVYAAIAQAIIIALGDIDLGVGFFVGLANCVVAVIIPGHLLLGLLLLAGLVVAYGVQGFLLSWRRVPSITFTLGASFVWLGIGEVIAPTPSGEAPGWLSSLFAYEPPLLPLPAWLIIIAAIVAYLLFFRSRLGLMMRAAGSNADAYEANGSTVVRTKALAYGVAGVFSIIAAFAVTGVTSSGDVNASSDYTLLTIAAVILGGASFRGGKMSAIGVVAGALVLSLVGTVLAELNISSTLQTGAEGVVLVLAIAGHRLVSRRAA